MTAVHAPVRLDAYGWFMGLLDAVGSGPIGARVRQCPAHGDAAPSLSVSRGADGRVLLRCHAGCDTRAVLAALHCPMTRLFEPGCTPPFRFARTFCRGLTFPELDLRGGGHPSGRGYRFESEHRYGDRWWLLRYRHRVTGTKEVSWECLNNNGQRVPGLLGTPTSTLPLYEQGQLRMGIAACEPVLLVESESSTDALLRAGWYATTWAGGAAAVQLATLRAVLGGYPHLVVIPDNDPPGLACLDRLAAAGLAPHVLLPAPGHDARDLLDQHGRDEFRRLVVDALSTRPLAPRSET